MMHPLAMILLLAAPQAVAAQVTTLPVAPPPSAGAGIVAGAQLRQRPTAAPRRPIAYQFDSLGLAPLGQPGDTVSIYLFPDGEHLRSVQHVTILSRDRVTPPSAWRLACDDLAHPGWAYALDAPATSQYGVVVPGVHPRPTRQLPPPSVLADGRLHFLAFADSVWQHYLARSMPKTEREQAFLWYSFHSENQDAGWGRMQRFGVRGPEGRLFATFSFWLRDDAADGTPNTTGTWIVDSTGRPVVRFDGNVDIYGTVDGDGDGVDDVLTSNGLIRWDGQTWTLAPVYSEEPCLARRMATPPSGERR